MSEGVQSSWSLEKQNGFGGREGKGTIFLLQVFLCMSYFNKNKEYFNKIEYIKFINTI